MVNPVTKTGLDVLINEGFARIKGADPQTSRVAVLGNPISVDKDLVHIVDRCMEHGVNLVRLFGPEHGIRGDLQDMDHVSGHVDEATGLEVISLYGPTRDSLFLQDAHLDGVDILVCDLQDIGSRYYTYMYTIAFALRACARTNTRCVVIDRPNPIGGIKTEGNVVGPKFRSFVGEYAIANQHGLTLGEMCHLLPALDQEAGIETRTPEVVWMEGYRRDMYFEDTGLPWVLPSPNMPTVDTAIVYPGGCLFEGTNLSEGRGTTRPFELVGAPYIKDTRRFAELCQAQAGDGVIFRPCIFRPTFQKHALESCGGVQLHVTDRDTFSSLRAAVAVLVAAKTFSGFAWRDQAYEYVKDRLAIDLLFGDDAARRAIDSGGNTDDVMALLTAPDYETLRTQHLHAAYTAK